MEFHNEYEFERKLKLICKNYHLGEFKNWKFVTGGIHTNICLENTSGNKYFLKIPRWQNISHNEFDTYKFLSANTNLPVAKPIYYDDTLEIFSKPYFVIEYLEGKACDFSCDVFLQMGSKLRLLHTETQPVVNMWPHPFCKNWREYLWHLAEENLTLCQPFFREEQFVRDIIQNQIELVPEFPKRALLHRDFKQQNVLLDCDENICGIVDFEWAHLGDPLFDLASTESYLSETESRIFCGYFFDTKSDFNEKLYCLYNLINLVHVIGRATYVLSSPVYFAMAKRPYLMKLLDRWKQIY